MRIMSATMPNKSNVAFYVRILPELNANLDYVKILENGKNVYVRCCQDFAKGKQAQVPNYLLFATNGVFYNTGQETIFDAVSDDELFEKLINGNNALIMCYGQTGSGKTLTTSGLNSTYNDRGILPRALEKLFALKEKNSEKYKICMKMRYLETNRNHMMDLLSDNETVYDMNNYHNIKGSKVHTLHEGLKMIFKAEARKTVRTNCYYSSNLASTIVTFSVFTKGQNTAVSEGTLHVVDLAGIDTIGNQSCAHKTGYEVGIGNLVKSQIEQLILMINSNFSKNVVAKHRLCISIHYLRNAINHNSIIRVLAHIRVQPEDLKISTSMLRLGCSFKGILPKKLSRFLETSLDVQYQLVVDEIKSLKKEIDLNSMLCNEDMSHLLSDDRLQYIIQLTMEYLKSDQNELVLLSTTDTVIVMKVIKRMYQSAMEEIQPLSQTGGAAIAESTSIKLSRTSFKMNESVSSATKRSRRFPSKASTVSVESRLKKSARKQRAHRARGDGATVTVASMTGSGSATNAARDTFSSHSVKSKRTGKKKLRSAVDVNAGSLATIGSERRMPEELPNFAEAWNMFKLDQRIKFNDISSTQNLFDSELEELTRAYNKEVMVLEELKNIACARQKDLSHAVLIKDIEAHPSTVDDLLEFQDHCAKLSDLADDNVVNQKEKLLRLQAEMRLNLEYRSKLKENMNKMYEEYCMDKYNVLVPDISDQKKASSFDASRITMDFTLVSEDPPVVPGTRENSISMTQMENAECKNMQEFEQLQDYMRRETARVAKRRLTNQRWIRSFHYGPHCSL